MRIMLNFRIAIMTSVVFAVAAVSAVRTNAQVSAAATRPPGGAPAQSAPVDGAQPAAPLPPALTEAQLQQREIQADTKKLYQLALELRTEVGKTYKQSLSVTVLKKAEELEKLSKKLRSEMTHEAEANGH